MRAARRLQAKPPVVEGLVKHLVARKRLARLPGGLIFAAGALERLAAELRATGWQSFDVAQFTKAGLELLNPICELEQEPNMPCSHLAALFNAQGPNANCLTACAASSQAIGEAVEIIRRGDAQMKSTDHAKSANRR